MNSRETSTHLIIETEPQKAIRPGWGVAAGAPKFEPRVGVGPCATCGDAATLDSCTGLCKACFRAWRFGSRA